MRCIAQRDGLIGTVYIHAGDEFDADKCPTWATPVKAVKKAPEKDKAPKSEEE